mgnify:FL=1
MFKDIEFKKIDWNNIHSCVTPSICYAEAMIEDINGEEYKIAVHSSFPNILFISKNELQSSPSFENLNKFYKENTQTICNNHLEVYSALYGTIFKELCKPNLNHKFRFVFTENGLKNVQAFIRECNAKRKEVLDAQLDTAEDTSLPTEGDILCDLYDNFDSDDGFYVNGWGVTDSCDYDLPLGMEIGRDFVLLTEDKQIEMHDMVYKPYDVKSEVNRNINYKNIKNVNVKQGVKDKIDKKEEICKEDSMK